MIPASDRLTAPSPNGNSPCPTTTSFANTSRTRSPATPRRGWRLDKPSLDTPNDSIIALAMALEALENQPNPVQVLGWL